MYKLIVTEIY